MNRAIVTRLRIVSGRVRQASHLRWALVIGLAIAAFATLDTARAEPARSFLLATTTSVRDSGLLDALIPNFTERTGIGVRVVAVGTGAALRMGREGNADVLLTHAPSAEQRLVDDKIVRRRTPFMENFFVIAGPPDDPAGVAQAATPEAALEAIAEAKAGWVSRADDSGTHKREAALFAAAGISTQETWPGFLRTGSAMGVSLQVAGEKRAYILSDIGTFLAFQKRVDLAPLSKPSPALRNVYSLLQLEATQFEHTIRSEEAEAFEAYLLSEEVLHTIADFGREQFGRALFTPISPIPLTPITPPEAPAPILPST